MHRFVLILVGMFTACASAAKEHIELLSTACEEALALSALPERLRTDATVYVLEATGYRKSRAGQGAFSCLVTRNHPQSYIPLCFDHIVGYFFMICFPCARI